MMRRILITVLLITAAFAGYTQSNQVEAKAAYLLAEEAFNAGEFENTVKYLDDAAKKLGGGNAKILYLKILAESEIAKKKPEYLTRALQTIETFQNSSDAASFNEEKVLEIAKLKLRLGEDAAKAERSAKAWRIFDSLFNFIAVDNWRFGMSLEEATAVDDDFFRKADKKVVGNTVKFEGKRLTEKEHGIDSRVFEKPFTASFTDNKLTELFKIWIVQNDKENFVKTKEIVDNLLKQFRFKLSPTVTNSSWQGYRHWAYKKTVSTYAMASKGRKFTLIVSERIGAWKEKNEDFDSEIHLIMNQTN